VNLVAEKKYATIIEMKQLIDTIAGFELPGWKINQDNLDNMHETYSCFMDTSLVMNNIFNVYEIADKNTAFALLENLNVGIHTIGHISIAFVANYMPHSCWMCGGGGSREGVLSNSAKPYVLFNEEYQSTLTWGKETNIYPMLLVVNGDTIRKSTDNPSGQIYKFRPQKAGLQKYTVEYFFRNPASEQASKAVGTFYYEVGVPNTQVITAVRKLAPVPILAELRGGDITREKLIFPITLQSEDERQTVLSFTLWHLQKGEEPKAYQIKANKIPAYILDKIQAGDQLQFVDIRGREKRDLPTMAFIVNN
jgi:hypothetical protein